jgi:hypothetical protein
MTNKEEIRKERRQQTGNSGRVLRPGKDDQAEKRKVANRSKKKEHSMARAERVGRDDWKKREIERKEQPD